MTVKNRKTTLAVTTVPPSPVSTTDEIWTPEDVAAFLKLGDARAVYELTRKRSKNPLPARRVGKQIRFSKNEVLTWFYGKAA